MSTNQTNTSIWRLFVDPVFQTPTKNQTVELPIAIRNLYITLKVYMPLVILPSSSTHKTYEGHT
ncbi:MAG: hypothetical protein COA42_13600 [Alteromonadaceae bacterium]|nr:MAG: hypothetical protein COA42_13600 [Alteromonadaceae bacterium]